MKNYNLNDLWMNTNLMCMSEKISSVLNNIKWKKILYFTKKLSWRKFKVKNK